LENGNEAGSTYLAPTSLVVHHPSSVNLTNTCFSKAALRARRVPWRVSSPSLGDGVFALSTFEEVEAGRDES
jgi:hypothetical protein